MESNKGEKFKIKKRAFMLFSMLLLLLTCSCGNLHSVYEYNMDSNDAYVYDYFKELYCFCGVDLDACGTLGMDIPVDVVIPETFKNTKVKGIFMKQVNIRSITVNHPLDTCTILNSYGLESIVFNSDVTIDYRPIYCCPKLNRVEFNGNLTQEFDTLFSYCSLEEIIISKGTVRSVANHCGVKSITLGKDCEFIGDENCYLSFENKYLEEVTILNNLCIMKNTLKGDSPKKYTFAKEVTFNFDTKDDAQFSMKKNGKIRILADYEEWKNYQASVGSKMYWKDNGKDDSYLINFEDKEYRLLFNDSIDVNEF